MRVRDSAFTGETFTEEEQAAFDRADAEMFSLVRGIFGGHIKLAISGAAPIAPDILRFFYAAGVPVMEGWGMTETTAIGTLNLPDAHRFGSIGRAVAGADIRIADDGEIEMAGPMLMKEYWRNPAATAEVMTDDGYLRTGDLGSIDDDGYVAITGRKKDIIITAGGKNLTPANLEGDLRRSRWISQVVMYGDRKPYPVAVLTLDLEAVRPWAEANGHDTDPAALAANDALRAMIQADLDDANAKYARVEQIKRFRVLRARLHARGRRAHAVAQAQAQRGLRQLRRPVRVAVRLIARQPMGDNRTVRSCFRPSVGGGRGGSLIRGVEAPRGRTRRCARTARGRWCR